MTDSTPATAARHVPDGDGGYECLCENNECVADETDKTVDTSGGPVNVPVRPEDGLIVVPSRYKMQLEICRALGVDPAFMGLSEPCEDCGCANGCTCLAWCETCCGAEPNE